MILKSRDKYEKLEKRLQRLEEEAKFVNESTLLFCSAVKVWMESLGKRVDILEDKLGK